MRSKNNFDEQRKPSVSHILFTEILNEQIVNGRHIFQHLIIKNLNTEREINKISPQQIDKICKWIRHSAPFKIPWVEIHRNEVTNPNWLKTEKIPLINIWWAVIEIKIANSKSFDIWQIQLMGFSTLNHQNPRQPQTGTIRPPTHLLILLYLQIVKTAPHTDSLWGALNGTRLRHYRDGEVISNLWLIKKKIKDWVPKTTDPQIIFLTVFCW